MSINKLNIVEAVWQRLHLKKIGDSYWCGCPFHTPYEETMVVMPRANRFYCIECQETGDVKYFLEKYEGKSNSATDQF